MFYNIRRAMANTKAQESDIQFWRDLGDVLGWRLLKYKGKDEASFVNSRNAIHRFAGYERSDRLSAFASKVNRQQN